MGVAVNLMWAHWGRVLIRFFCRSNLAAVCCDRAPEREQGASSVLIDNSGSRGWRVCVLIEFLYYRGLEPARGVSVEIEYVSWRERQGGSRECEYWIRKRYWAIGAPILHSEKRGKV